MSFNVQLTIHGHLLMPRFDLAQQKVGKWWSNSIIKLQQFAWALPKKIRLFPKPFSNPESHPLNILWTKNNQFSSRVLLFQGKCRQWVVSAAGVNVDYACISLSLVVPKMKNPQRKTPGQENTHCQLSISSVMWGDTGGEKKENIMR